MWSVGGRTWTVQVEQVRANPSKFVLIFDLLEDENDKFSAANDAVGHAALGGEIEQLRGITENVIVGSNIPIGSGTVDLYMQVSKKK